MIALIVTALIAAAIGFWLGYEFKSTPIEPSSDAWEREAGLVEVKQEVHGYDGPVYYLHSKHLSAEQKERILEIWRESIT